MTKIDPVFEITRGYKMNPEDKELWLTALRSGEYPQGRNQLCGVNNGSSKFCCLGVYAEVKGRLRSVAPSSGRMHAVGSAGELFSATSLPSGMLPKDIQNHLMSMNDDSRMTFAEIADWIEANL